MRILIVQLSAGFAGTERHASELANGLAATEQVAILLRAAPAEPHRHAQYAALRASLSPAVRLFLTHRATPWWGLRRAIRRFRPDVIHAHHERSARVATFWPRPRAPVAATLHIRYRRDFARCDGLIALTPNELANIPTSFRGVRRLIENWVLPHPPPDAARRTALRAELGLDPDSFVIGSVGRLAPVKRMDGLIDAFASAALPHTQLLILGDGEARPALQTQLATLGLSDRIRLPGFRADARDCLSLLDLFVSNADSEPYGLAILEAAAAGIPVLATATAGATTIAARLPITLLPIGDTAALAGALIAARHNPPAAPALHGFDFADRRGAILNFYRAVLDARSLRRGP